MPDRRTLVVGGFREDTRKQNIEDYIKLMTQEVSIQVERVWCPFRRGSIGFVRFVSRDYMWRFLDRFRGAPAVLPDGSTLWVTVEKTRAERAVSKTVGAAMRALIASSLPRERLDADYRRGIVWLDDVRIAMWTVDTQHWSAMASGVQSLPTGGAPFESVAALEALLNASGETPG